jgi:hypothetical protein
MSGLEVLDSFDWRLRGACARLTPAHADRFFFGSDVRDLEVGRSLCAGCPVREPCLELADSAETGSTGRRDHMAGVWAGLYPRERRNRRRNRS